LGVDKEEKERILTELGGLPEKIYDELLHEHLQQTKARCVQIQHALQSDNFEDAYQIAHSIKGASGNLRMQTLYDAALAVEIGAKSGEPKDTLLSKQSFLQQCTDDLISTI